MKTVRLTAAQAMVDYLAAQFVAGAQERFFAGAWAIFGHGNVAGVGHALAAARQVLPTYRAHNEQAMAHAAIAFAKQSRRRRAMICTTSIGPGATNMVTAAALAHVNRLPVLFVPGDVFASRLPDPVLQQVEDFGDGTVSANDCFRPVSRYFDRIVRPEQLLDCLPRAMATLLDPAQCGPVTLAFCQDVQAEAYDFPESFFRRNTWRIRAQRPDPAEMDALVSTVRKSRAPLVIAGGGVLYSGADSTLDRLARASGIPVAETQAGKGSLRWDHPCNLGAIGVTGTSAANAAAAKADTIIAVGTRLQDFTTGSRALFSPECRLVQVNASASDASKHGALAVVGDARAVLEEVRERIGKWQVPRPWRERNEVARKAWDREWEAATRPARTLATDAQVLGAVWRAAPERSVVVCAAGGLPGELHKLWRAHGPGSYHVEYGYSCMGYEIAGGLGAKMADPRRDVFVLVGDGSYLMMNSEIATSVSLGMKLTIVVLDNHGFGCIDRLQRATGAQSFNNLFGSVRPGTAVDIDFAAHAASLGATAMKVNGIAGLEGALAKARAGRKTSVIVIETDPAASTLAGGTWWEVAVPEVSARKEVKSARSAYERQLRKRAGKE